MAKRIIKVFSFVLVLCIGGQVFATGDTPQDEPSGDTFFEKAQNYSTAAQNKIAKVNNAYDNIKNSATLDMILNGESVEFPVIIPSPNGDPATGLVLEGIEFTPTGGVATVSLRFPVGDADGPGDGEDFYNEGVYKRYLYFYGDNIAFSKTGGFTGEALISLVGSVNIPIGEKKDGEYSTVITAVAEGDRNTFVSFSCDGFEQLHLNADISFSEKVLVPALANGEPGTGRVTAQFETDIVDWQNWLVDVSIDRFLLKDLPGFTMEVDNLVVDHSDFANSSAMSFPADYDHGFEPGQEQLWQGVYIRSIESRLPKALQNPDNAKSATIKGSQIIIDDNGFSGKLEGKDLITPDDQAPMGDWKWSLDYAGVDMQYGQLIEASVYGQVVLPITESEETSDGSSVTVKYDNITDQTETAPVGSTTSRLAAPTDAKKMAGSLALKGVISRNDKGELDYAFSASVQSPINFNALKIGKVNLKKGSRIDITAKEDKLKGEAHLFGDFELYAKNGDKEENKNVDETNKDVFVGGEFSDLVIRTHDKPKIELAGEFKITEDGELSKLPIQVTSFKLLDKAGTDDVGLNLGIAVSFMDNDAGFGGETNLTIWANKNTTTKRYQLKEVLINEVYVNIEQGAFSLKGMVRVHRDHPIYGDGFKGCLDAVFQPNIKLQVEGMFGNVESKITGNRFKYWYASVQADFPAFPIFPAVAINSFKGGVYYHLHELNQADKDSDKFAPGELADLEAAVENDAQNGCSPRIYIPDETKNLGVIAGIGLQSFPTDKTFNGDVEFRIEFNANYSPSYIAFDGYVGIMNKPDKTGASKPQIAADWKTEYLVDAKILSGTFNMYVNVDKAGIKGIYEPNGKAGQISFYVSPDDWYFYLGQASEPIGIKFKKLAKATAYFVCGSVLPSPVIAELPEEIELETKIDYSSLGTGAGFAFGARAGIDIKSESKLSVGIKVFKCTLYVGVEAYVETGFDLMMTKSAENYPVMCQPWKDGQTDPVERGMKGWYATGQAYLLGRLSLYGGVRDCIKFRVNLLDISLHAAVFAQLPNPTYFQGVVDLEVQAKPLPPVKMGFNFKGGDICVTPDGEDFYPEASLVSSVYPPYTIEEPDRHAKIAVYDKPTVRLVYKNGHEFSVPGKTADPVVYTVQANTGSMSLVCLNCTGEFSDLNNGVAGTPVPSDDGLSISFVPEETLPSGFTFSLRQDVLATTSTSGYADVLETVYTEFVTGEEPLTISNLNIQYSYPLPDMENFYPNESNIGYLKTQIKQRSVYALGGAEHWEVRYLKGDQIVYSSTSVSVDELGVGNNFEFPIPDDLELNTQYRLQLVRTTKVASSVEEDLVSGEAREGLSPGVGSDDIIIVNFPFKTSRFRTFADKFANYVHTTQESVPSEGILLLSFDGSGTNGETFSETEVKGESIQGVKINPLVQLQSTEINPEIVGAFKYIQEQLVERSGGRITASLQDAVTIGQEQGDFTVSYEVPKVFKTLSKKVEKFNEEAVITGEDPISIPNVPDFEAGSYTYRMAYTLPGKTEPNSIANVAFKVENNIALN